MNGWLAAAEYILKVPHNGVARMPTVGLLFVKNGLWMCVGFFLIIYSGHEALEKRFPLLLYMVYCWEG